MMSNDGVAVDTRLRELFHNDQLVTVRLSPNAKARFEQALWYVWGRQDAGDDRTRYSNGGHYLGADFGFAAFAACEAEAFDRQYCCFLSNIGSQYARFVAALS